MMNDRQLLELAAQAAGMHVLPEGEPWPIEDVGWFFNQVGDNPPALYNRASKALEMWAPLTDDADAFRLSVKIQASICIRPPYSSCSVDGAGYFEEHAADNGGQDAATRRAVVRAAAAMAKGSNDE